jgi:hypothetical protein
LSASEKEQCPFSRCRRTHFARFSVIEQPSFNGRDPGNGIVQAALKTDLLAAQSVDTLACSWLLLAINFDANDSADSGLHDYLVTLWDLMHEELGAIYRHCHGFSDVRDGKSFARYIERCQVETTMSFNDYWTGPPALPSVSLPVIGGLAALAAVIASVAIIELAQLSWLWALLIFPASLVVALYGAYRFLSERGARPFPTAPNSDLRSILKAIYLQQRFALFAADAQGLSPEKLHEAFSQFLNLVRPEDIANPTQAPGIVRS